MSDWLGYDISRQDHVDGSNTLRSILANNHRLSKKHYPFNQWLDHEAQIKKWFLLPRPQANTIEKFSLTTGVMQNPTTIFHTAENFVLIRGRQGFRYCDATIAPQYHILRDMTCPKGTLSEEDVVKIFLNGLREGEKKFAKESLLRPIETHLIFGIGREVPPEESLRLVKIALQFTPEEVPAIDFVCDESRYPLQIHTDAIKLTLSEGRDIHAHAGEWVNGANEEPSLEKDLPQLLENIGTAVSLGCKVINHARVLAYDKPLMEKVAELGIGISSCPGNYLASGYIKDIKELRLTEQLEAGVKIFLDHDDDLFFPTLNEVAHMCLGSGLTMDHLKQMLKNSWDTIPGKLSKVTTL